jgi:hypothetical protein
MLCQLSYRGTAAQRGNCSRASVKLKGRLQQERRPPDPLGDGITGGRRRSLQICQESNDEGDYEDQPQEVVDRDAPDDREDHQQNDK